MLGDVTIEFASRFAQAVELLAGVASAEGLAAERRRLGAGLERAIAGALDAVALVHEADTSAVKDWAERRAQVLARVGALRAALARGGANDDVRREAGALLALVGPPASAGERSRGGAGSRGRRPPRRR